jgi:hypothetical protein
MKKFYVFIFSLLIISLNSSAQTIPNNSFETWITYPGTSIKDPANWASSNLTNEASAELTQALIVNSVPGITGTTTVPPSAVQTTGHTGTYAIKVLNVEMTSTETYMGVTQTQPDDTLAGYASVYSVTTGGDTLNGIHVTSSPAYLNGFYKFNQGSTDPSLLDTGGIFVGLTKWNSITMMSDSIGYGQVTFTANATTYTPFSLAIINTSGMVPDTALIGFNSTSTKKVHMNTYLIVDDLSFSSTSGITPAFTNASDIALYPNPAIDQATIKNLPKNAEQVFIMDYTGRRVANISGIAEEVNVNTSSFAPGLYFYNVVDNTGTMLYTSRFTVSK